MTKDAKPERKVRVGSTLRLELHLSTLACYEQALTARDVGELFGMLMDEAALIPVRPASNDRVQRVFDRRDDFRVIKGGFGRATLSLAKRRAVFERDGGKCAYCGSAIEWSDYHCDHIEPVSKGGSDAMSNLTAACSACNLSKKAKLVAEWVR